MNMLMLIQKSKIKKLYSSYKKSYLAFIIVVVLAAGFVLTPYVRADSIDAQIRALQAQNAANNNAVAQLESQASSYQDAINRLQAAINALQAQIDANVAEQARLQAAITAAEVELAKQKGYLSEDIRTMYLEGQISTLEMLASSRDLSDFLDKQEYRTAVQNKVKDTLDKVTALKAQLKDQKLQIDALLAQQNAAQANLTSSRNEQNNLLAYNENQQAAYNAQTRDNQSKINGLIAAQRRANFNPDGGYYFIRFGGNVTSFNPDDYPYKNSGFGMSSGPGCVDNDGPDRWGYCTRQCVSYAAWAVEASGRSAPMFWGNARDWVGAAYARGITVSRSPEAGDIAISTSGYWGHAMYVESVSGSTFHTSEYNTYLDGRLTYQNRSY